MAKIEEIKLCIWISLLTAIKLRIAGPNLGIFNKNYIEKKGFESNRKN